MIPRTRSGHIKFRPVRPGSRVALVAPASPLPRAEFDAGVAELIRIGLEPVHDASVFDADGFVAGPAETRAAALMAAMTRPDVDAVIAVRGGFGSVELLPHLDAASLAQRRTALVGYSDITSLHLFLNGRAGMTSVHGAMLDRRIARGPSGYDVASFLASLSTDPLGELAPDGVEVLRTGDACGPCVGGTITQIAASLGTPYGIQVPPGAVLFLEDIAERPYRLRRLLTQLAFAGVFARAAAIVLGELPGCDEPSGVPTARATVADFFKAFAGPVLFGFPSGHTTTPVLSLPLGVEVRVVAGAAGPRVSVDEAAAG